MQIKNTFLFFILVLTSTCFGQIPILNSNPPITDKVIYLDFDGQKVIGTGWNNGNLVNAAPSTMSPANIILIWKRMREDYRAFDVNLTTDSMRYNNANPISRQRTIITPTSSWYAAAGGVSYLGSFNWGGTPGTPNWVFENQLGNSTKNIAEAAAHEVGHCLTLRHQSTYDIACNKTNEYHPGIGTGVTSWAPIMGVGYSKNVTTWYNGTSSSCTIIQLDHSVSAAGIRGPGYLNFLPDDIGGTYATAKFLNLNTITTLDSGLIGQPSDVDAFRFTICNSRYVSFAVKPWALDTVNYSGADLDIRFALYNSSNVLLATDTSLIRLSTLVGMNLTAGDYYFTVDGGRSNYYSDYGSMGMYYISIKATNPPALANTIVTSPALCAGQLSTFSSTSNGVPSSWQWTITGTSSNTSTAQNPAFVFTTAGFYTVTLLATNSSSLSCPVTITLNVGNTPTITVVNPNGIICPFKKGNLSVSGASSYVWMPGGFGGSSQIISPAVTTQYTITGYNGMCSSSALTTVSVTPSFTVSVSASSPFICYGQTSMLTAGGASSYTFEPGSMILNPAVVSPTTTTTYTVTGNSGACLSSTLSVINVNPYITSDITVFSPTICAGKSAFFAGSSANNYTVNPGNITLNPAVVSPTVTTNYTITVSNSPACSMDTVIQIGVSDCNLTGIRKLAVEEEVLIYPNPANGKLFVEQKGNYRSLEIYNTMGELIYSHDFTNAETLFLSCQNWARGIYVVKLRSNSAHEMVRKLVLE